MLTGLKNRFVSTVEQRPKSVAGLALALLVAGVLYACDAPPATDGRMPPLAADLSQTTVSGISSGAYMAGQFQLAHPDLVTGAAIIAGGPFGCAESALAGIVPGPGTVFLNASRAVSGCMLNSLSMWGVPNPDQLARQAISMSENGQIGSLDAIRRDRVYLFSGRRDRTVRPGIVRAAADFYRALGLPEDQVKLVDTYDAGHAFITLDKGLDCAASSSPFVEDCDYDQAGSLLAFLYPAGLEQPSTTPAGRFVPFDQTPYTRDLKSHSLSDTAVLYVPDVCAKEPGCRVHVAFHGCVQNMDAVGDAFTRDTGFGRWADTNRLIVMFPQTAVSALNPKGCWDWWGYTGRKYLTREAPQIVAVHRMLQALAGNRATN